MRTLLREPFEYFETHALQRPQSKLSQDLNHSLALDFLQASQAVPHLPNRAEHWRAWSETAWCNRKDGG